VAHDVDMDRTLGTSSRSRTTEAAPVNPQDSPVLPAVVSSSTVLPTTGTCTGITDYGTLVFNTVISTYNLQKLHFKF
jgi:hypothetical protein